MIVEFGSNNKFFEDNYSIRLCKSAAMQAMSRKLGSRTPWKIESYGKIVREIRACLLSFFGVLFSFSF